MAVALSDYLVTVRRMLHDANDVLYPLADKIAYINAGMQQRDWLTGGNRQTFTIACSTTTDTYTFATLAANNAAPVADVIAIAVLDGQLRILLNQLSMTKLNAWYRGMTNYRGRPEAFARYGTSVILSHIASTASFQLETDATLTSVALVLTTDTDPLPPPFTDPVPYYACFQAKLNARRYAEAQTYKEQFYGACSQIVGMRVGLLPTAYGSVRR